MAADEKEAEKIDLKDGRNGGGARAGAGKSGLAHGWMEENIERGEGGAGGGWGWTQHCILSHL